MNLKDQSNDSEYYTGACKREIAAFKNNLITNIWH